MGDKVEGLSNKMIQMWKEQWVIQGHFRRTRSFDTFTSWKVIICFLFKCIHKYVLSYHEPRSWSSVFVIWSDCLWLWEASELTFNHDISEFHPIWLSLDVWRNPWFVNPGRLIACSLLLFHHVRVEIEGRYAYRHKYFSFTRSRSLQHLRPLTIFT